MESYELLSIALIGFCVSFIGSSVAIGSGVFLASSLAFILPPKEAIIIGAPIIVMADMFALIFYWKQRASTAFILKILLACTPGLLLGVLLLPVLSASFFKFSLGIFGMLYALSMAFPHFPLTQWTRKITQNITQKHKHIELCFFGTLAGLASIFAHACGLVLTVFLSNKILDKRMFAGTLIILYSVTDILKTAAYLFTGLLDMQSIFQLIYIAPCMLLGSYLGNISNNNISTKNFRALVLIIIFLASFNLCL